jgi:hypothetical protein
VDPTHDLAAKLAVPPTPLEMAQLATASSSHDHSLNAAGMMILRRLMFAYERRTRPVRPAGEVGEALKKYHRHGGNGRSPDWPEYLAAVEVLAAAFAAQFEGESM